MKLYLEEFTYIYWSQFQKALKLTNLVRQAIQKQKLNPLYPYHLHEKKEVAATMYRLDNLNHEDISEV